MQLGGSRFPPFALTFDQAILVSRLWLCTIWNETKIKQITVTKIGKHIEAPKWSFEKIKKPKLNNNNIWRLKVKLIN